jgi:N-acetylmuramoyl-L-alanine amidase
MKICSYFFCLLGLLSRAQTLKQCKQRFDSYLNFRSSLNKCVRFEADAIFILNSRGKKEFAVYSNELPALAGFFENSTVKQQEQLMIAKGIKKFSKAQLDSLSTSVKTVKKVLKQAGDPPLKGYRIAIDPGHFSTNMVDAQSEQKYLFFVKDTLHGTGDTVKIFESLLTFNTAHILKNMLEEQGAEIFMTRNQSDFTSFNCTYQDWIKSHRRRTLDSLQQSKLLSHEKYKKLLKCNDYTLFWEFFRDYDLANRANKINAYAPDLTIIIHYNVDEKNAPWKQHTKKNYTMTFIGGAFTANNLSKTESRIDFLRLLITDQLNRSEDLSARTVASFNKLLGIPVARAADADYLRDNCLSTSSTGVFCRNLALCRKINSPLVYGESLYQDNENESIQLMRSDLDLYGIKANERLNKVALSYYEAVMSFLKN